MLRNSWQNPEVFDEIDHQVRVQFGLIDGEEASVEGVETKKMRQFKQIL